jgi:hypothetical protein
VPNKDAPNRETIPARIAAGLVVPVGIREAEPVPRRHRVTIDLQEPQAEPPAFERTAGELPMERPLGDELGARPSCGVEVEQDVEVSIEPGRIVGQPKAQGVFPPELPRVVAHLVTETPPQ